MRAIVVFFIFTFFISAAMGQHPHENKPTKVVELHPGLGNYHHPITTKSAEAQTYFDQGLTLLLRDSTQAQKARVFGFLEARGR